MQIAIIEDFIQDQNYLISLINEYCANRNISAEITTYLTGDSFFEDFKPGRFQCVFLDIYMDGTDGMQTARQIYKEDPQCRLIFATVSVSSAVTSYEVRASWYLNKPFTSEQLTMAMDAACEDMIKAGRTLQVHVNGLNCTVRYQDIYSADCSNRHAKLHLQNRSLTVDEPISVLLEQLSADERFLLCNRNTLVNMEHIELVDDHVFLMKNGNRVPVRQRGRAALKKEFLAWSLRALMKEEQ